MNKLEKTSQKSSLFSRENDKQTLWLLLPRFSASIEKVKRYAGRACIHVVDAVSMVTRGHEMVKKDPLQNLAPTRIFLVT